MTHLKTGDEAPNFEGLNQNGETISLADYKGKKLVLFFYPKDNTRTCTIEVCNLRDHEDELKKAGYEILGVSPDGEKSHQDFIEEFDLPYPLIADTERKIIHAYGIWGPKKFMGKEYEGLYRTTFLIDEEGQIERVIEKVKSKAHTAQILAK